MTIIEFKTMEQFIMEQVPTVPDMPMINFALRKKRLQEVLPSFNKTWMLHRDLYEMEPAGNGYSAQTGTTRCERPITRAIESVYVWQAERADITGTLCSTRS